MVSLVMRREPHSQQTDSVIARLPYPATMVIWLTGLSGAGKTTLARAIHERLTRSGRDATIFDGDELRATVSRDLGFTKRDRDEQVRRVAKLAVDAAGSDRIAIVALISPYRAARESARALASGQYPFIEVYLECPVEELSRRDPKGLYRGAAAGEVKNLTGISDPYEVPQNPELRIDTSRVTVDTATEQVVRRIGAFLSSSP